MKNIKIISLIGAVYAILTYGDRFWVLVGKESSGLSKLEFVWLAVLTLAFIYGCALIYDILSKRKNENFESKIAELAEKFVLLQHKQETDENKFEAGLKELDNKINSNLEKIYEQLIKLSKTGGTQ
jgi:hypothetical protein